MADECSVSRHIDGKRSTIDGLIGRLAGVQHGVVGRRQLTEAGVTAGAIEGRLRRGSLHRVHRGVYAVGHRALTQIGWMSAAVLAAGSSAALSHRSAGWLLGIIRSPGRIEVTRQRGWRAPDGVIVHRGALRTDEVVEREGVRCTSLSRTLFDLAAVLDGRALERAINEAEVRALSDFVSPGELLGRHPRRRGARRLRTALERFDPIGLTESELEDRFLRMLERQGLPRPRVNAPISARGHRFVADFLWRAPRLIVELDGRAFHRTDSSFEADRQRDRLLVGAGWRVVRITWRQLRDEELEIARQLAELLEVPPAPTL